MKKLETALVFADIMGANNKSVPRKKEDFE